MENDHESIIKVYDVYENRTDVILVLELVSGGELFDFISEKEKLSEDEAAAFIKQILLGCKHMHEKNIVHLDLKPENVMLTSKESQKIKLIDFGLSQKLVPGEDICEMMGTPEFVAPEVINYEPLHLNTDIWAVGVITYILLSGASPFLGDDKQSTFANVVAVDFQFDDNLFSHTSQLAKDFIRKIFVKDPRKRVSVHDCLRHPWIRPVEKKQRDLRRHSHINIDNLKAFIARKRWKQSLRIVSLCNRLSRSLQLRKSQASLTSSTKSMSIGEDEEDNFVLTALFCASEEGNINGIKDLLSMASIDINQANKHGETVLHRAAMGGYVEIINVLQSNGIDLHARDKNGDSAIYWAARQGHVDVIKYLCDQGVSLDTQNKSGEAAIHVAARYGHAQVVAYLCSAGADINLEDQDGETPLHNAAGRGNLDCVKVLLAAGAKLGCVDRRGCTALHWACRRHHTSIALHLIHAGCPLDVIDETGESALHSAASEGIATLVQAMCSYGADTNVISKHKITPLHLAAKAGHLEIVRTLLLAGADPDIQNRDGVIAEILALAQGHSQVADLLIRMKPDRRVQYINQLIPTHQPLNRIKFKVFGGSGVGKSTLIGSLKCGYFTGFFRKRITSTSAILSHHKHRHGGHHHHHHHHNGLQRHRSLPNQLSFHYDIHNSHYTKGIDIQAANISGAGDLSFWEFSGYEPYYLVYDHFIGDTNCIHAVLFNLMDTQEARKVQTEFWLNFIRARIPPMEPIGYCGKRQMRAKVVLIATHADQAGCHKNSRGEHVSPQGSALLYEMRQKFQADLDITECLFVVDAHTAMSSDMRALRHHLANLKADIVKSLPTVIGFTSAMVSVLPSWRRSSSSFPVLSWQQFIEYARSKVNPLAGEDHLKTLIQQLQLMGEVIYLETDAEQDLVILNPKWLCNDTVGNLLSHEKLSHCRQTGCFTVDDFQMTYPDADALDLLQVLQALELCLQCENDGDIEYEFPCLNFVERLMGLWDKNSIVDPVYGGVRLQFPGDARGQLMHMFPRIQVQLRKSILHDNQDPDSDLYQWYRGSKFCCGNLEGMLVLENEETIEIKVRGPKDVSTTLYYFLEDLVTVVEQVLLDTCPGLYLERNVMSSTQLKKHSPCVHSYSSKELLDLQLDYKTELTHNSTKEDFFHTICLESEEIRANLTWGTELHVSYLPIHTRRKLASLLDEHDPMGCDWCLLAVALGLEDELPNLDSESQHTDSKTEQVLEKWGKAATSTVGQLVIKLKELGRHDAVQVILTTAIPYRVFPPDEQSSDGLEGAPGTYNSSNTVSDLSR